MLNELLYLVKYSLVNRYGKGCFNICWLGILFYVFIYILLGIFKIIFLCFLCLFIERDMDEESLILLCVDY